MSGLDAAPDIWRHSSKTHRLILALQHILREALSSTLVFHRLFPTDFQQRKKKRERENHHRLKEGSSLSADKFSQKQPTFLAEEANLGLDRRERAPAYHRLFLTFYLAPSLQHEKERGGERGQSINYGGVRRFLCILRRTLSLRHLFTPSSLQSQSIAPPSAKNRRENFHPRSRGTRWIYGHHKLRVVPEKNVPLPLLDMLEARILCPRNFAFTVA